jgi:ABC-type glycerol-3-phosphate transport system substrate-binding protein
LPIPDVRFVTIPRRLLNVANPHPLPRREFLIVSAATGLVGMAGCRPAEPPPAPVATRVDVPLRLLLCGSEAGAEALRRAWGGISDQPLAIERISAGDAASPAETPAAAAGSLGERLVDAFQRNDVGIVPCGCVPELHARSAIVPLGNDLLTAVAESGEWLGAVDAALVRWAGKPIGIPLGMPQPALLINEGVSTAAISTASPPQDWSEYLAAARELAKEVGDQAELPAVAEPLAGGDAAKTFLWRVHDADPAAWLFDRETFVPALATEPYVRALESLKSCAELYGNRRLTAGEVWDGVANGSIRMAIGWPGVIADQPRVTRLESVWVGTPPRDQAAATDTARTSASNANWPVLPDADSPLGLIGSRCRQTAAAKRFLIWVSGGEGSELIQGVLPGMTVSRVAQDRESSAAAPDAYQRFLLERLATLQVRPALRLLGYDRYLQALDDAVLACLDGKLSARDALTEAASRWQALTLEYGPEDQAKAWRFAQGLRF